MSRVDTFTFRVNEEERRLLAWLAGRLERSQSDVMRWLLRGAAAQLKADDAGQRQERLRTNNDSGR